MTVPPDFTEALEGDPAAKTFFDGLSYSNRLRVVLSIEGAKTAETRHRRIEALAEHSRRPAPLGALRSPGVAGLPPSLRPSRWQHSCFPR